MRFSVPAAVQTSVTQPMVSCLILNESSGDVSSSCAAMMTTLPEMPASLPSAHLESGESVRLVSLVKPASIASVNVTWLLYGSVFVPIQIDTSLSAPT